MIKFHLRSNPEAVRKTRMTLVSLRSTRAFCNSINYQAKQRCIGVGSPLWQSNLKVTEAEKLETHILLFASEMQM